MRIAIQSLPREVRIAVLVVILGIFSAVAFHFGLREFGLALGAAAAISAGAFFFLAWKPSRIPADGVLSIRLAGAIRECAPRSPIDQLRGRANLTLFDLRQALEFAARDARVRAVVVRIAGLEIGLANADELHLLLRGLVRAGKRTVALIEGDSAGIREYLIACPPGTRGSPSAARTTARRPRPDRSRGRRRRRCRRRAPTRAAPS